MAAISIHSLFFFVSDLERSKAFYRNLLDIEPVQRSPNLASFDIAGVEFMLHADGDAPRVPPGSQRGGGVALHIQVQGIHELWERLHGLGIPLAERPTQQPYGFIEFAVHDPDGYEVEFVEPSQPPS
jgi:catechol 2,3-dioxygenase-like lactoylglutathione lyase family enzyme